MRRTWESSARAPRIERRVCAAVYRSVRSNETAAIPTKRFTSSSGGWPRRGLLEYRLARSPNGEDEVVIEPQVPAYWPRMPPLGSDDVLVLSRFAYLRRRANAMVLESPRAGALFKIGDPQIAAALASLSAPQQIRRFRRRADFPGVELLALLVDCQILFKVDAAGDKVLRAAEGDDNLVVWDFHDLLFHARSTEGRHANPVGGTLSTCRHRHSAAGGTAALAGTEVGSGASSRPRTTRPTRRR